MRLARPSSDAAPRFSLARRQGLNCSGRLQDDDGDLVSSSRCRTPVLAAKRRIRLSYSDFHRHDRRMDDEPERPSRALRAEFFMLLMLIGVPLAYAMLRSVFVLASIILS